MSPQLFGERIQVYQKGLDFSALKNRVISSNIANVETPGYKAFRVVMEEKMKAGNVSPGNLNKTNPAHLDGTSETDNGDYKVVRDTNSIMRADGNNVDLERELSELSANAIYYTAVSRFIAKNFAGLRTVISEGKR